MRAAFVSNFIAMSENPMKAVALLFCAFLTSCGSKTSSQSLGGLGLVKVYTVEDHGDNSCESLLKALKSDGEVQGGNLLSQTLSDFEADGFATIQIGHIPAEKRLFVLVHVSDPDTNALIGHGCAQNIEVRKGAVRDVPIILQGKAQRELE
jgi:hypothetical protein